MKALTHFLPLPVWNLGKDYLRNCDIKPEETTGLYIFDFEIQGLKVVKNRIVLSSGHIFANLFNLIGSYLYIE